MGFRVVVVKSRAKLSHQLNYLVCRGETESRVHLSEINTLIVQSTAVSLTASLLAELVRQNIKVVFCDEKCNPHSELLPCGGNYRSSKRIKQQVAWQADIKTQVWQSIIKRKILLQSYNLQRLNMPQPADMLYAYSQQVEINDATNREGHAAKVYFNNIFGEGFSRQNDNRFNAYLNFGYTILLSAFNREIVAAGYLTQLGIWHDNEFNEYNFSCDLMEPFRAVIDILAVRIMPEIDFKPIMIDSLNQKVKIDGKETTVDNAIRIYFRSVVNALDNNDVSCIKHLQSYEL